MPAEKEKLLEEAYQQFMQFAKGNLPLTLYDAIVAENYMGYGTGTDEIAFSAKDIRDMVKKQREQGEGMEILMDQTPVFRRISINEDMAIVVAEISVTLKSESIHHAFLIRNTTVLEFLNSKWIVVHSHGSKPDNGTIHADTWGINEWKRKNEELQKLVDVKTADLETKNKELIIEACLERVRAQAMSMKEPADMLEVCRVISEQLILLGVKEIRNVQTAIIYKEKGNYLNYEYYCLHDKKIITEVDYTLHKAQKNFATRMMAGAESFHEEHFSGKELSDWVAYQSTTAQFVDTYLYTAASLNYYFYSMGPVAFGVSTYVPLKVEDLNIVKRFRNVFELAYTRFLDIQQAEAQTREAQIELALERVRSRAMAMQQSEELADLVAVVFKELTRLEFPLTNCIIWISNQELLREELWVANSEINKPPQAYNFKSFHHPFFRSILHGWKEKDQKWIYELSGQEKLDFEEHFFSEVGFIPEVLKTSLQIPEKVVFSASFSSFGALEIVGNEHISDEKFEILHRFGKVFDLSYTRFNDIRKAEKQAKEAQIELSLERVRARTMAMQQSDELKEVVKSLFDQLTELGLSFDGSLIFIFNKIKRDINIWIATTHLSDPVKIDLPYDEELKDNAILSDLWQAIDSGQHIFNRSYSGNTKDDYFRYVSKYNESKIPDVIRRIQLEASSWTSCLAVEKNSIVGFDSWSGHKITNEDFQAVVRFAGVFEQAYTRFLDLQKAEAQAREGQIELALERVRARTMAMQHSDELKEAANLLFQQIHSLGIPAWSCGYNIWEKNEKEYTGWMSTQGSIQPSFKIPLTENPSFIRQYQSRLKGEQFYAEEVSGQDLVDHYNYMKGLPDFKPILEDFLKAGNILPQSQVNHIINFSHGNLIFITSKPVPESWDIFKRFAKVFEQTFTRFLDLQKAEAQAREAQIETALEKVRSRTMAMQNSNELQETAAVLFQEFKKLGTEDIYQVTIGIYNEEDKLIDFRATSWAGDGVQENRTFSLDMNEPTVLQPVVAAWKAKRKSCVIDITGEKLERWLNYRNKMTGITVNSADTGGRRVISVAYYSKGHLSISTPVPVPSETIQTLERFAAVFDATYTRFLDLQKAEAQAREAQIESALEKVRSRTMAMQKSDELADAAYVLFQQLNQLGVTHERINIGIVKEEANVIDFWITEQGGNHINTRFSARIDEPTTISKVYAAWKAGQKSMIVDLSGEDLKSWLKYLTEVIGIPFDPAFMHNRRVQTAGFFSKGMLVLTTPEPLPEESIHLLEKFAVVFDLTYTRFNDLLLAEAQTHKANIEVALERVRARALAMQEPEELIEVAQVLRHEMGLLGVEELETSSIYIHDDNADTVECWYAITDIRHPEKKLVADHITIDLQKTWVGRQMFDFYQSDKTQISILMQGANRIEWIKYCAIVSSVFGDFYGETIPDRTYHLYKFSNGAIGAASPGDISTESWELLSRTASVFSLAYSRFKDLTKARIDLQRLKEEKQRAELALTDLKAAQAQLVQSEKMASLGELTAGIAHEIQNPLNFVNNFSEVNKELLVEMDQEIDKGNMSEVKVLVKDLMDNEDKISHHGKRADAIVKGMLQHSRTTSGEKQPTDINSLTDEYLRLAYHGLRAKDKNFNAALKSDFDPAIGKINIIPQDIGRVLLNLINNAFYAVDEKKKQQPENYEPTVSVSTKKSGEKIVISVADNGNGIPQKVLDKIFQPFFTTKPTGQGTGLGLSLSYDIVKTHGGMLKVDSEEGVGSEFLITLPILKV